MFFYFFCDKHIFFFYSTYSVKSMFRRNLLEKYNFKRNFYFNYHRASHANPWFFLPHLFSRCYRRRNAWYLPTYFSGIRYLLHDICFRYTNGCLKTRSRSSHATKLPSYSAYLRTCFMHFFFTCQCVSTIGLWKL